MKKGIIILIAMAGVFLIASCKKDNTTSSSSGLLKSWTLIEKIGSQYDTLTNSYTYDNQKRITKLIVNNSLKSYYSYSVIYTYYVDSVIEQHMDDANPPYSVTDYLNNKGYITSNDIGLSWSYDSNGYLISSTIPNYGTSYYTYNANYQLTTETDINSGNTTYTTFSYQNNDPVTDPYYTAPFLWLKGKSTGALCWMSTSIVGSDTTTTHFTNIVDSQNRLTQRTQTPSTVGSTPAVTFYTYY